MFSDWPYLRGLSLAPRQHYLVTILEADLKQDPPPSLTCGPGRPTEGPCAVLGKLDMPKRSVALVFARRVLRSPLEK